MESIDYILEDIFEIEKIGLLPFFPFCTVMLKMYN